MHKYGGDLGWKAHLRGLLIMHGGFLGVSNSWGCPWWSWSIGKNSW